MSTSRSEVTAVAGHDWLGQAVEPEGVCAAKRVDPRSPASGVARSVEAGMTGSLWGRRLPAPSSGDRVGWACPPSATGSVSSNLSSATESAGGAEAAALVSPAQSLRGIRSKARRRGVLCAGKGHDCHPGTGRQSGRDLGGPSCGKREWERKRPSPAAELHSAVSSSTRRAVRRASSSTRAPGALRRGASLA